MEKSIKWGFEPFIKGGMNSTTYLCITDEIITVLFSSGLSNNS
jgi:hypothetical protein